MQLILASASPRRQKMLEDLGLSFKVCSSDISEKRLRGEPARNYALRLSKEKAENVAQKLGLIENGKSLTSADWVLLAADTIVVFGTLVLGKPTNAEEAVRMLKRLSGCTHEVITAFHWLGHFKGQLRSISGHVHTKVTFSERSTDFWKWYVTTGEPMDKAGAYAAQGIGMSFIERVSGSYSNVVGLPLSHVLEAFKKSFGGDLIDCCRSHS